MLRSLFTIVKVRALLIATAVVAALVRRGVPLMNVFTFKVLLGLFLGDRGAADGVLELGRALIGVLDDVNEIAAEGVLVDEVFDLQR